MPSGSGLTSPPATSTDKQGECLGACPSGGLQRERPDKRPQHIEPRQDTPESRGNVREIRMLNVPDHGVKNVPRDGPDVSVSLGDGVSVETRTLGTVVFDASRPTGDINIVTHAHTDHLPRTIDGTPIICSALTAALGKERRNLGDFEPASHAAVELLPAGHIEGSRAALIDDDGCRILFTGDVTTRDRPGIRGFEPVPADVLILEATYGSSEYSFPPIADVATELLAWIEENHEVPTILFGYALGRAQRIFRLLEGRIDGPIRTTPAVDHLNAVIAEHHGRSFQTEIIEPGEPLIPGETVVVPAHQGRTNWLQNEITRTGAKTAGCTGWAIDRGYRYRRSIDRGFVLSDHCDHAELINLVECVEPQIVYTHHGYAVELAKSLTREGYRARALTKNQRTLDSFGD